MLKIHWAIEWNMSIKFNLNKVQISIQIIMPIQIEAQGFNKNFKEFHKKSRIIRRKFKCSVYRVKIMSKNWDLNQKGKTIIKEAKFLYLKILKKIKIKHNTLKEKKKPIKDYILQLGDANRIKYHSKTR